MAELSVAARATLTPSVRHLVASTIINLPKSPVGQEATYVLNLAFE